MCIWTLAQWLPSFRALDDDQEECSYIMSIILSTHVGESICSGGYKHLVQCIVRSKFGFYVLFNTIFLVFQAINFSPCPPFYEILLNPAALHMGTGYQFHQDDPGHT